MARALPSQRRTRLYTMSMIPASAIILVLSLCTQIISADLNCTSPISTPGRLQPVNAIELGFTMDNTGLLGLDIAADLICSSTGKVTMSLGKGFNETDLAPNSPMVNITEALATDAVRLCPSNNFHVRYTASLVITSEVANCSGNFSIQAVNPGVQVATPLAPSASLSPSSSTAPSKTGPVSSTTITNVATPTPTATTSPSQGSHNTTTATTTITITITTLTSTATQQTTVPSVDGSGDSGNDIPAPSHSHSTSPSPSAGQSSSSSSADLQESNGSTSTPSSSPSIKTVAITSGSVVGGIAAILSMMLIWRKHHQRRQSLDQMYSDSLVASSGLDPSSFSPKPIFARDGTGLGIASPPKTHRYYNA